jgi:hypothetical protein
MHVSLEFPQPTDYSFHGIFPRSTNYPLGRVDLDVCFGSRHNFRREKLEFKVIDWPSQYHAILGRPVFLRFMAIPHYNYLVLKIPGPNRVITVKGSFKLLDTCDKGVPQDGLNLWHDSRICKGQGRHGSQHTIRRMSIPNRRGFRLYAWRKESPGSLTDPNKTASIDPEPTPA